MATLNWLFLVGFLSVAVEVTAFQSNVFAVPSAKQWNYGMRTGDLATGRCSAYGTNHESFKSSYMRSRLAMARDSGNAPQKGSKRKRFKESIKKILSYPKNIRKKQEGQQEGITASAETAYGNSTKLNREGKFSSGGVNGSVGTTESVNGSGLSLESTSMPAPTAVLDRATTTQTSGRTATTQTTDLSGNWQLIVSDEFKTSYDNYLKLLGQPSLVRSVALSIIGMTSEETIQSNDGRELIIRGRNVRGFWERKLEASTERDPLILPIVTADQETVQSECWWSDNGRVHHSWLREVNKYGGGSFESKRYLEDGGDILVCESSFFPTDSSREKAGVSWRFRRMDKN